MNQPADGSGNTVKLILAWLWVGIPILWALWVTFGNVAKLFAAPVAT
jgi:hypothetical protein